MSDRVHETRRPWKKRLRYSLSTFLVLVTALAIWFATVANRARRQSQAVHAIETHRGVIHFDYQYDAKGKFSAGARPPALQRLRTTFGEDFFRRIVTVDFAYQSRGPLGRSKVRDKTLACLAGLRDITTLEIGRNAVADAGLVHLRHLRRLKILYLYRTYVHGPGLAHLVHLPALTSLSLDQTPLIDVGLTHIGRMPQLTWLRLSHTRISDAGVPSLTKLENLADLSLAYTNVTDTSLETLRELEQLQSLDLRGTHVTAEAVAAFKAALPNCRVSVSYGLGLQPETPILWENGHAPTAIELADKVRELGPNAVAISDSLPDNPVVALRIHDSRLSDETARQILDRTPHLETLNFRRVLFGDGLLPDVGRLASLRYLSLQNSQVTDAGIQHLAEMPLIEELNLTGTSVTDTGILHLKHLTSLRHLDLHDTFVTFEGVEQLRQALPDCHVSF